MAQLNYQETQTATAGQTVFNLSFSYAPTQNTLRVYVNGSKQILSLNYVETNPTRVTFLSGLNLGDVVEFICPQG
jgi:uncharacterized protein involved in exopolysaccharide biosynthesis